MAWDTGHQIKKYRPDILQEMKALEGDLTDEQARAALGKLLRYNLGFTWLLASGQDMLLPFQEIILNAWFEKDYSLVIAGRGVGKCIEKSSVILTKRGFLPISDCRVGDEVWTKHRFCPVEARVNNPLEAGKHLITRRGYDIKGKIGHKFLVLNPDSADLEYKNIEDAKVGDWITVKYGMDYWLDYDIAQDFPEFEGKTNSMPCELDTSDNFFYFLGLLLGDGCTRHGRAKALSITSRDEETHSFLRRIGSKMFPNSVLQNNQKKNNQAKEFKVVNDHFIVFLDKLGFNLDAYSYQKVIPEKILQCRKSAIRCLLQGLFDTDGTAGKQKSGNGNNLSVEFYSSSEGLAKQVQRLLLNFGIFATMVKGSCKAGKKVIGGSLCNVQQSYRVRISGKSAIKRFYNEIGFRLQYKQEKITTFLKAARQDKDYNSNRAPIGKYLKNKYGTGGLFRQRLGYRIHDTVSMDRVKDLIDNRLLTTDDEAKLGELLNDFSFVQVKDIKDVKVETVDIQVAEDECYWSDGTINHNSYLLAIFILLYALFNERTKIVLVANNFRRVKDIFSQMENFLNHKKATLLRQCFEMKSSSKIKMGKQNDQYLLNSINGSVVKGLPLGVGENLRGERANVLIIDEGLLVSEHIQKTILEPFLTARSNAGERVRIEGQEAELVKAGLMKEEERTVFQNNKLIITSSASYQFEYLYEGLYTKYINNIQDERKERLAKDPTYFVCRASYEVVPDSTFLADEVIQAARETNPQDPVFRREYCAEFVDGGGSYFDIKKLHECTIPDGELPTIQVSGQKHTEYILAIDPSYGDSKSSDYFAMGVYMLDPLGGKIVQVHSYGKAGTDIKEHYEYLIYLLKNFNIVFLTIDASGTEFIQGFNESQTAKHHNIRLGFLEQDFETDGDEYQRNIDNAKMDLNSTSRHFVYAQPFNGSSIRAMNEYLQGGVSAKKVWFASKISARESTYQSVVANFALPYPFKDENDESYSLVDFLDDQDDWIEQTKRQLALIEVKSTTLGTLQYDIPSHLKKSKNAKRARRDNYTCLLMAYTAAKHYFMIRSATDTPVFQNIPVIAF